MMVLSFHPIKMLHRRVATTPRSIEMLVISLVMVLMMLVVLRVSLPCHPLDSVREATVRDWMMHLRSSSRACHGAGSFDGSIVRQLIWWRSIVRFPDRRGVPTGKLTKRLIMSWRRNRLVGSHG
jgi:hypothetical protein